jgi:hypothetical protein
MKKNASLAKLCFYFLLFIFYGCKDLNENLLPIESKISKNGSGKNLKISGQQIEFTSLEEFENLIKSLKNDSLFKQEFESNLIKNNYQNLKGFYNSFNERKFIDLIKKKDIEKHSFGNYITLLKFKENTICETISDKEFQLVLNEKREIKIGNSIYEYNYGSLVEKNLLNKIIKTTPIKVYSSAIKSNNKKGRAVLNTFDVIGYDNNTKRVYIESEYIGFYNMYFQGGCVRTHHQKKFWGWWYNNSTVGMQMMGSAQAGTKFSNSNYCGTNWFESYIYAFCMNCSNEVSQFTGGSYPCYYNVQASSVINCDDGVARNVSVYHYSN